MRNTKNYKIIVVPCEIHTDKWMIVWGEHCSDPSEEDKAKMLEILEILFPGKKWKSPSYIPEHWHWHEV